MGGEVSVFQEGELERDFWKYHGPNNESWLDLFRRSFSGMTNMILQPKRFRYTASDLIVTHAEYENYQHEEFTLYANDISLHCAKWSKSQNPMTYVIYLHTNTRSLVDAIEVLPLCSSLNASLISFDHRGCGQSGGNLSFGMSMDLDIVVQHVLRLNSEANIVLWARGMSTAIAIEYLNSHTVDNIKALVLDTPFTTAEEMVHSAASSIKAFGLPIHKSFIGFIVNKFRKTIEEKLGSDPYAIQPMNFVKNMKVPCYIMSADSDDYIPTEHGMRIAESWPVDSWYKVFNGRHFGPRDEQTVLDTVNVILKFVATSNGALSRNSSSIFRVSSGTSLALKGIV